MIPFSFLFPFSPLLSYYVFAAPLSTILRLLVDFVSTLYLNFLFLYLHFFLLGFLLGYFLFEHSPTHQTLTHRVHRWLFPGHFFSVLSFAPVSSSRSSLVDFKIRPNFAHIPLLSFFHSSYTFFCSARSNLT